MTSFDRPGLIRDGVYAHLKGEILSGHLPGGARLAEIALAERLGVSRTPVREAVQRLAQDGLVEVVPNRGARVRTVTPAEVEDTYAVREALDGLAARLAAAHRSERDLRRMREALARMDGAGPRDYEAQVQADLEFHAAVAAASGNPTLQNVLSGLEENVARLKLLSREHNQDPGTREGHRRILAAVAAGDGDAAEAAARAHVSAFRRLILSELPAGSGRPAAANAVRP